VKFVQMFHPDTGGEGAVPETAVNHHLSLGWVVTQDLVDLPDLTEQPSQEEE